MFGAVWSYGILWLLRLNRHIFWFSLYFSAFIPLWLRRHVDRRISFALDSSWSWWRCIWLIKLIFFRFFRITIFASRHFHLFLWLIASKLLNTFLSFPLNLSYSLLLQLLQLRRVCGFVQFYLKCIVFGAVLSHHRLRLLHSQKYSFLLPLSFLLLSLSFPFQSLHPLPFPQILLLLIFIFEPFLVVLFLLFAVMRDLLC